MNYLSKKNIFVMTLLSIFFVTNSNAITKTQKELPIDRIYSPRGYDSLDSAEIVISGYLPNRCYKEPRVEVERYDNIIEIKAIIEKPKQSNTFCPEAIVPFVKTVDLGVLDVGIYNIKYKSNKQTNQYVQFIVREPRLGSDKNELYANVHRIEKKPGKDSVVLHGYNPSDCYALKEVNIVDNGRKTVSILPRVIKVRDFCPLKMVPFQIEVDIKEDRLPEKVLLHVRSMQGESVNMIY